MQQKVIDFIRINGPVLPIQISKKLNIDTLLASAVLSELVSKNKLRMSNAKIGGSPVYYLSEQQAKLEKLYTYLGERQKEAYDLIKEKGVLKNSELQPVERVALNEIKDFAVKIEVSYKDKKEVFWKWYLLSEEEFKRRLPRFFKTEQDIKSKLESKEQSKEEEKQDDRKKEAAEKLATSSLEEAPVKRNQSKKIIQRTKEKEDKQEFANQVDQYLQNTGVKIIEKEIKRNQINMVVLIPSSLGELKYFCRAINKKKVNEQTISLAYADSRVKDLPLILLVKGKLTKKAESYVKDKLSIKLELI